MAFSNGMKIFIVVLMTLIGYLSTTLVMMSYNYFFTFVELTDESAIFPFYANKEVVISNEENESVPAEQSVVIDTDRIDDYPFKIENDYGLGETEPFEITFVTYASLKEISHVNPLTKLWAGPVVAVLYYTEAEEAEVNNYLLSFNNKQVTLIPSLQTTPIPINKLKNLGISNVQTSHFIVSELNLVPSRQLYRTLKATPGYLSRDPYFVGVVPVYEWSSDQYESAKRSKTMYLNVPTTTIDLTNCLKSYTCRPMQTTTIPLQFVTFSYIHYRNMNCLDANTEVYMLLKKSSILPAYDETVVERGYDNIVFVEMLRRSSMKFGMLADEYLFHQPKFGISSNVTFANWGREDLRKQYDDIINKYAETAPKVNPTTRCEDMDGAMYTWIGFKKYVWLDEKIVDGKLYPKVAVLRGKKNELNI